MQKLSSPQIETSPSIAVCTPVQPSFYQPVDNIYELALESFSLVVKRTLNAAPLRKVGRIAAIPMLAEAEKKRNMRLFKRKTQNGRM